MGTPDRARRHFAERTLSGLDDAGQREEVRIWIDWLPGGIWGVGRAVDLGDARESRASCARTTGSSGATRCGDALEAANAALCGRSRRLAARSAASRWRRRFSEAELRPRLERWFHDQ